MINWDYIEGKRQKYYNIYSRKVLIALRKTIMPVIKQSRVFSEGNLNIDLLITDYHIRKVYQELYLKVGKAFIKDLTRLLSKSFQEDLWEMEMMRYVNELAGNEITLVSNYTRESIQMVLKQVMDKGLQEGLSVGDIMKNLRRELTFGDYATFTKARALRIAKTEVMTASNQGGYIAASLSGANIKVWLTAPTGVAKKERHNAIGMNGTKSPLDHAFDVDGEKMMFPGDSSQGASARNIINCNCGLTYELV
jgi:hypothetical protein